MKPVQHRRAVLALLAALSLAGCRTAGVDNLARPAPIAPQGSMVARDLIAEHNRNAGLIQSFEAQPAITIVTAQGKGGVNGRLALERPQNFKLEMAIATGSKVADIGSNDDEFWFWVKDSKQRAVYYCKYNELATSALAATFQPDWIIEAMGLRVIPEAEVDDITVRRGTTPGTLELTHRPTKSGGRTTTRVTILDESTHRIREHRLLSGDQKTLLARATVTNGYLDVPIDADSDAGDRPEKVYIPRALRLEWVQEKMTLDVVMNQPKARTTEFSQVRRDLLFVEPKLGRGFERINLARQPIDGNANANATEDEEPSTTTIRETMPAPPTRVRLGEPSPLGLDMPPIAPGDPLARSSDDLNLPTTTRSTATVDQYVGPRIPSPPEPEPVRASSRWQSASPAGLGALSGPLGID